MPSTTTAGAKICCKCGADVAGKKRLKDHNGQYWCADCAHEDEKKKRMIDGGVCAGCGDFFQPHAITVVGHAVYCHRCLKTRARQETAGFVNNVKDMLSGSKDHEKRTVLWMLIVSAVLVAVAVWRWVM